MTSYQGRQGNRQEQGGNFSPSTPQEPVEKAEYRDGKGNIAAKWVDSVAERVAQYLGNEKLKPAQLRRFYSEVKTLERVWMTRGRTKEEFALLLPQVKILKAKAIYAKERGVAGDYFQRWISEHVNAVNTSRDFEAFLLHFEAVVGFSKQYLRD